MQFTFNFSLRSLVLTCNNCSTLEIRLKRQTKTCSNNFSCITSFPKRSIVCGGKHFYKCHSCKEIGSEVFYVAVGENNGVPQQRVVKRPPEKKPIR